MADQHGDQQRDCGREKHEFDMYMRGCALGLEGGKCLTISTGFLNLFLSSAIKKYNQLLVLKKHQKFFAQRGDELSGFATTPRAAGAATEEETKRDAKNIVQTFNGGVCKCDSGS